MAEADVLTVPQCNICLDKLMETPDAEIHAITCGHVFLGNYLRTWLGKEPARFAHCPLCNYTFTVSMKPDGGLALSTDGSGHIFRSYTREEQHASE